MFRRKDGRFFEEQRLVPATTAGDRFGFAVALDRDTAVVRSNGRDYVLASGPGLARVFERRSGVFVETRLLRGPDGMLERDVAVDGDDLVLGPRAFRKGTVRVYSARRHDGKWSELEKQTVTGDLPGGPGMEQKEGNLALHRGTLAVGVTLPDGWGVAQVLERRP